MPLTRGLLAIVKIFAHLWQLLQITLARRDWAWPRPSRPVLAAGDMTDFGRAAHVIDAAGAAWLAARAHEGMATAASTGHGAPTRKKHKLKAKKPI